MPPDKIEEVLQVLLRKRVVPIATGLIVLAGTAVTQARGQPPLPQGTEPVALSPADFTTRIDNPYWPMAPGTRWVYRETDFEGNRKLRTVVTVTDGTRRVGGVTARVVESVETENGAVKERSSDWYAQDRSGNVWYLGEDTKELKNGKFVDGGSWQAGSGGAHAGVAMPANPKVGMRFRQELNPGQSIAGAQIFSLDEQVEVAAGRFKDVVMTKDTDPLERKTLEYKYYARGVGPALTVLVSGGREWQELVKFTDAGPRRR